VFVTSGGAVDATTHFSAVGILRDGIGTRQTFSLRKHKLLVSFPTLLSPSASRGGDISGGHRRRSGRRRRRRRRSGGEWQVSEGPEAGPFFRALPLSPIFIPPLVWKVLAFDS